MMSETQEEVREKRIFYNPLYRLAFILAILGTCFYVSSHYLFALDLLHASEAFSERVRAELPGAIALKPSISEMFVLEEIKMAHRSFWNEAALHASIGFFVAAALIVAVELRVKKLHQYEMRQMREDIARNVWQAVAGRSLPSTVTSQLDNVLRQNFIKEELEYVLTLEPVPGTFENQAYQGKENEYISVKREETYYIRNISAEPRPYDFGADLINQYPEFRFIASSGTSTISFPRHCSLTIGKDDIPLPADCSKPWEHETKPIPANGRLKIHHVCMQIYRVADVDFEAEMRPVDGVRVRVHNQVAQRVKVKDALLTHPMMKQFEREPSYEQRNADFEHLSWHFPGGLLPGHTIIVIWEASH